MPSEFADVVFPLTVNQAFTYRIPPDLRQFATVGSRVIAPFGPRRLTGFLVALKDTSNLSEVKDLLDILDLEPLFSKELYKLAQWISDYYLCRLADVLKATLPSALMHTSRKYVEVVTDQPETIAASIEKKAWRQAQILRYLAKSRRLTIEVLTKRIGAKSLISSINELQQKGWVRIEHSISNSIAKPKVERYVKLVDGSQTMSETQQATAPSLGPKQEKCLMALRDSGQEILQKELLQRTGASLSTLKSLERRKLITIEEREVLRDYYEDVSVALIQELSLNEEQKQALSHISTAIDENQFKTFLLYGVTGSGKTQVYIEAIHRVLAKGKNAIVLVPEISLTPQTVQRFRSHFKEKVAVLHSAMSDGERYDSWRRLKSGTANVAIGPRSAVFAPLENIGLIVVDEEQEDSYKQSDPAPRYHARDVAVVRARSANAVVILGSATPSAESYYNAQIGKYHLLELKHRIDDVPLPMVNVLDMAKEKRLSGKKGEVILSRLLSQEIEKRVARKEQIILLLNRRGFSSYIKCKDCGEVESCENCQITLTYHLRGRRLRCHYCGFTKRAPDSCRSCSGSDILFRGLGTQQVEEELNNRFPNTSIVRMDLDTTTQKRSHDRILQDFEQGKYDILLGTQMIAKGLDFQRVTLVGVINADIGLLIPDFRASERTFQLLTQVAGRAGRKDLRGEVIIQTYSPNSFCLVCAREHDFMRFFNGDILERRELLYPPFGRIISVLFKGQEEDKVIQAARKYADVLKKLRGAFQLLGPTPSPILKIKNHYRWHIILKGDKTNDPAGRFLRQAVLEAEELYYDEYQTRGVQIAVDVDPVSLI
ncbi:primosomal protein N' [candidate division KSB1 bacterium]|nr:primosomal protein N' [candidate division KSB1 bacterium]NIR68963.1 primosomal protein N' [candidate division KSB1 bacterium]NIS22587.1 primosomal protein N' [candidate division KSB1 bacterium]NIT69447.1 primosomal protein N' [candidate division KSB1 bacterium]NIU23102.1 primosomal protein N' [candidate division KSB1 bacterium]